MVKKAATPEPASKPAEQPLKKKIAARIVKATPVEAAPQSDAAPLADIKVVFPDRTALCLSTQPLVLRALLSRECTACCRTVLGFCGVLFTLCGCQAIPAPLQWLCSGDNLTAGCLQAADAPSKAAPKKAPKSAAKKAVKAADAGATVKRAKNAFMFFSADKRAAVKGDLFITIPSSDSNHRQTLCVPACLCLRVHVSAHNDIASATSKLSLVLRLMCRCGNAAEFPDLSMGDMSKKLGEMWKEASSEERDTYKVCHALPDITCHAHPCLPEAPCTETARHA